MRNDHVTVVTPLLLSYGEIWVFSWKPVPTGRLRKKSCPLSQSGEDPLLGPLGRSTYDRICILITRIFHEAQVLIEKIRWIEARTEDLNVVVVCPIRTLFC